MKFLVLCAEIVADFFIISFKTADKKLRDIEMG